MLHRYNFWSADGLEMVAHIGDQGRPVVLLHGAGVNASTNWIDNGIASHMEEGEIRPIALDLRGHGESAKPTEAAAYHPDRFAEDVMSLADSLGLDGYAVAGYSLGCRYALATAATDPRVERLVLGELAMATILSSGDPEARRRREEMLDALDDPDSVEDPLRRRMAHEGLARLKAMGIERMPLVERALFAALSEPWTPAYDKIRQSILVLLGQEGGAAEQDRAELSTRLPQAQFHTVPGNHMTALLTPEFVSALVDFLR